MDSSLHMWCCPVRFTSAQSSLLHQPITLLFRRANTEIHFKRYTLFLHLFDFMTIKIIMRSVLYEWLSNVIVCGKQYNRKKKKTSFRMLGLSGLAWQEFWRMPFCYLRVVPYRQWQESDARSEEWISTAARWRWRDKWHQQAEREPSYSFWHHKKQGHRTAPTHTAQHRLDSIDFPPNWGRNDKCLVLAGSSAGEICRAYVRLTTAIDEPLLRVFRQYTVQSSSSS